MRFEVHLAQAIPGSVVEDHIEVETFISRKTERDVEIGFDLSLTPTLRFAKPDEAWFAKGSSHRQVSNRTWQRDMTIFRTFVEIASIEQLVAFLVTYEAEVRVVTDPPKIVKRGKEPCL